MKRCQGGCNRNWSEYYVMPDNKILCIGCWERGIRNAEALRNEIRNSISKDKQEEADMSKELQDLWDQRELLKRKIQIEKDKCGSHHYLSSLKDYSESDWIPHNYSEVKQLENELEYLNNKHKKLKDNLYSKQKEIRPRNPQAPVDYFTNGVYYDARQAAELERREETERLDRLEKERREKERLLEVAQSLNNGTITDHPDLETIIERDILFFDNPEAIFRMAKSLKSPIIISKFIKIYGHLTGFYDHVVENPSLNDIDTMLVILYDCKGNAELLTKLLANKKQLFQKWFDDDEFYDLESEMLEIFDGDHSIVKRLYDEDLLPQQLREWGKNLIFHEENNERIKNGDIRTASDLEYAEDHINVFKPNYKLLKSLASRSQKVHVLSEVFRATDTLPKGQRTDIYFLLLKNRCYESRRDDVLSKLIDLLSEKKLLLSLEKECKGKTYEQWLKRMHLLGYISNRKYQSKLREMTQEQNNSGKSSGGSFIGYLILLGIVGYILYELGLKNL